MTLRARRWYYSFAILLFLLTAPLLVATASGWRWTSWRQGFVQTGTLLLNSAQRAEISLDGRTLGVTPKRISGLAPGLYHLKLTKVGFSSWTHIVRIKARTTTTIGPVRLFPENLRPQILFPTTFTDFITTDDTLIAGWSQQTDGINLQILWPKKQPQIFSLPEPPTWIRVSPRQQRLAIGLPTETRVYSISDATSYRQLPAGDPVAWLSSSDTIAYRLESGRIIADDSLKEVRTEIGRADSMRVNGNSLLFSLFNDGKTTIFERSDATEANARSLTSLDGNWQILATHERGFILQNVTTGEGLLLSVSRLTNRLAQIPLGIVSTIQSNQNFTYPLWINGADLLTLGSDQLPYVIERSDISRMMYAWVDAPHLLVSVSTDEIVLRSVSSRQGRTTLVSEKLLPADRPLMIDAQTSGVIINRNGQLVKLNWK